MKANMGTIDRTVRVLAATDQITGLAAGILGLLALIFVITSLIGFCPLYVPFKISTKKIDSAESS